MGFSGGDNIVLEILSTYDGSGTAKAKSDLGALGNAGKEANGALLDLAKNNVGVQIGAFEALGKKIDVTNAAAVQGYRAQGDALAVNLVKLGATEAEINRVSTAIGKVERSAGASLLNPNSPQTMALTAVPSKAKAAANALGIMAQAAVAGGGSIAGLATAVGNLSAGLATLATSAKAVAAANWIALLIQLSVAAGEAISGFRKKTRELNIELGDLQSTGRGLADVLGGKDLAQKIEQINQSADDQIKKLREIGLLEKATDAAFSEHARQRKAIENEINANRQRSIDLATTQLRNEYVARAVERADLIRSGALNLQLEQDRAAGRKREYDLEFDAITIEQKNRDAEIRHSFVRRSSSGEIIALNAQEIEQLNTLLEQNNAIAEARRKGLGEAVFLARQMGVAQQLQGSGDLRDQFQGRLAEIELQKAAEIKATGDVLTATASAEQRKTQLYMNTTAIASRSWVSLAASMTHSMNTAIAAHASLGKILTAALLEPIAKELLALSESEAVKAIAHFAAGDLLGGGLHTAASGLAALAAAKVESIGGLGSLGGGGGGGGGAAGVGGSTFTPRAPAGGGDVIVNLYTVDPYSGENISKVSWQLQRAGITKKPIWVPPTSGLHGMPS